jgi:glycosyltransferase involved in cell wall biosynthesis
MPPGVGWEVVVVDDGATPDTADVVAAVTAEGHIPDLRLIAGTGEGVAAARRLGLGAAKGDLVAFVDDDCVLDPAYGEAALVFLAAHPRAGAVGSRNHLIWEAPPPPLADLYGDSLARQDLGPEPVRLPIEGRRAPVGAGLVVRREAVAASGWLEGGQLRGRVGRRLRAGEDAELVLRVAAAGWDVWYAPPLKVGHVVPRGRTTIVHLVRLQFGFGLAEPYLRALERAEASSWASRRAALADAGAELKEVAGRFRLGFIRYTNERPTWVLRLAHSIGRLVGAGRYAVTGRAR